MPQYRKRPVIIDAEGPLSADNYRDIAQWCGGEAQLPSPSGTIYAPGVIAIDTLEGMMWASDGDYIIRGVQGEFYPCKPDIFEQTYEPLPS